MALVGFGGVAGGVVTGAAAWADRPLLAVLLGFYAALGSAAALHALLPRRRRRVKRFIGSLRWSRRRRGPVERQR